MSIETKLFTDIVFSSRAYHKLSYHSSSKEDFKCLFSMPSGIGTEGTSSSETSIHTLKTRRSKRYVINVPYRGRASVRESSSKLKADRSYTPHQDKFSRRSNKRCFKRRLPFISKQYIKAERKIEHYTLQTATDFASVFIFFFRRDHLWSEISRRYFATENVSKTKCKTLICYF